VLRRGWEAVEAAAGAQHAALLAAAARSWRLHFASDWPGREVAAALAAIGPPGSAPMLAALGYGDQGALRFACESERRLEAVALLVRAYGESPDACAGMLRVLEDDGHAIFHVACRGGRGGVSAVGALLGAYRRAGRSHEALAADDHAALRGAASAGDDGGVLAALLAEYGEPGSAPVLAALARARTAMLGACNRGEDRTVSAMLAAYGPPGCAAARASLAMEDADGSCLLRRAADAIVLHQLAAHDAVLAALVAALGERDSATALHVLGTWLEAPKGSAPSSHEPAERLARIPVDSLLARLAVQTPQAWSINGDAARTLLSVPLRASLALSVLLPLRRLPDGVATPLTALLRRSPWLLFAAAAAVVDG